MPKLSKKLDMAPYHSRTRIKGHGKSKVNFFMLKNDADRVAFLQKMFSTYSWWYDYEDHQRIGEEHKAEAERLKKRWASLAEAAMQKTFGRSYTVLDYRVSGIARSEFPKWYKAQLRFAAQAWPNHRDLAQAHLALAARLRRRCRKRV